MAAIILLSDAIVSKSAFQAKQDRLLSTNQQPAVSSQEANSQEVYYM
jgi:hypothetical protein